MVFLGRPEGESSYVVPFVGLDPDLKSDEGVIDTLTRSVREDSESKG